MTKKEIVELQLFIKKMKDQETPNTNIKFKYALARIGNQIKSEIDSLYELETSIASIIEPLNEERAKIYEKYGELTPDKRSYNLKEETKEIAFAELDRLKEANASIIEDYNKKTEEYMTFLEEESSVKELFKMNIDYFPDYVSTEEVEFLIGLNLV